MAEQRLELIHLGVGDEQVPRGRHVCYVFGDDDERFDTLARYFRAGVEDGDGLLYFTDEIPPEELRRRLAARGADLGPEPRAQVQRAADLFYPDGHFRPETTLGRLAASCRSATCDGLAGVRCSGEMSWARRGVPGSERLLEYEVMLNDFFETVENVPQTGICQYDARTFDGPTILALLEIHPLLLLRGQILRNPNPVRSGEALQRFRAAAA